MAIARALVNNPPFVLADEPTGALDSRTSVEIMAIFQRAEPEPGITIIVVTHEPDIAAYSNRHRDFKDGHLVSDLPSSIPAMPHEELEAASGRGREGSRHEQDHPRRRLRSVRCAQITSDPR